MKLETEADVVASLAGRAVTVEELYEACEAAGVTGRDAGGDVIHGRSDTRWKRRARNSLQALKRSGRARRVGAATWVIEGTREHPKSSVLVIIDDPSDISLVLGRAAHVLGNIDDPFDLIVADPPWALNVPSVIDGDADRTERAYERDSSRVVHGYQDVPVGQYAEFTEEWVAAAAAAIRPGGHLAIITGPQAAARVQVAAEDAGLTYLNTIVIPRPFALRCTRRFAFSHTTVTVLCAGPETSTRRFFTIPADLPTARNGNPYPRDVWPDVPKFERRGQVRYPCGGLHPTIVRRIVQSYTHGPENGHAPLSGSVCDPFLGGGTTALVCYEQQRRFLGVDRNPNSLRFAMARLMEEHVTPRLTAPHLAIGAS